MTATRIPARRPSRKFPSTRSARLFDRLPRLSPASLCPIALGIAFGLAGCDRQNTAQQPHAPVPPSASSASSTTATPEPALRTKAFQWQQGAEANYDLETAMALEPAEGGEPETEAGLVVRGLYHVHVLSTSARAVVLAVAMSGAEVTRNGERSVVLEDLFQRTPALLHLERDGTITDVRFPRTVPNSDRDLLKLVYGWEFVCRANDSSWETLEDGGSSRCRATYRVQADRSVLKTRSFEKDGTDTTQVVKASHFEALPGACWVEYLRGEERCDCYLAERAIGESRVRIALTRRTTPTAIPDHLRELVKTGGDQLTAQADPSVDDRLSAASRMRAEELRTKYANVPFKAMFDRLRLTAGRPNLAEAVPILAGLREMMEVRPDVVGKIAATLQGEMSPQLSALLTHALESANDEAAQAALAHILSHPDAYPSTALAQAVVAAGGLEGRIKNQGVIEGLKELLSYSGPDQSEYSVNDSALYALARLARSNSELHRPLLEMLEPRLAPGNDPEDVRTALLALGSAQLKSPETLQAAATLAGDPQDARTRSGALGYLGSLGDLDQSQWSLLTHALDDRQSAVQMAALDAIRDAGGAAHEQARQAVAALAINPTADPSVRETARDLFTSDEPDPLPDEPDQTTASIQK